MLAGTFFHTGLGLGLEDSGLGVALGLGCCWTCYKSVYIWDYFFVTIQRSDDFTKGRITYGIHDIDIGECMLGKINRS